MVRAGTDLTDDLERYSVDQDWDTTQRILELACF